MICLVWQDVKKQENLKKGFTITKLYEEMIIMLGKRYLKKWQKKNENDFEDLILEEILDNPVVSSLK
jgi:hypothetical protein